MCDSSGDDWGKVYVIRGLSVVVGDMIVCSDIIVFRVSLAFCEQCSCMCMFDFGS